jgi:hypothetical protein
MNKFERIFKEYKGKIDFGDFVIYSTDTSPYMHHRKDIWVVVAYDVKTNRVLIRNIHSENKEFETPACNLINIEYLILNDLFLQKYITPRSYNKIVKDNTKYVQISGRQQGKTAATEEIKPLDTYKFDTSKYWIYDDETNEETKMNGTVNKIMTKNTTAAKSGALIAAGSTLNGVIKEQVRNKVPRKYKKLLEHPLADVVVANVASFAVQSFASNNYKASIATEAMMQAAMAEFFASFNIEKIIADVLGTVNLDEFVKET